MSFSSFNPGQEFVLKGRRYVVDQVGPRGVAARPAEPAPLEVLTRVEFEAALKRDEFQPVDLFSNEQSAKADVELMATKGVSEYSPQARRAVALRKKYLEAVCPTGRLRCARALLGKALFEVWSQLPVDFRGDAPPSVSSFYEWRRAWINSSFCDAAIVPRVDLRGRRPALVQAALKPVLKRFAEEFYATSRRPTLAETHRQALAEVKSLNRLRPPGDKIKEPTLLQVRRAIDELHPYSVLERRYGKAKARARTAIYRAGPGASRLLERVEVDHTQMDVYCVAAGTHAPLGRPWLTVLIDVATRMIVGAWISFHRPNSNTVLRVLKQGILRKEPLLARLKLKGEWPVHGLPIALVMDNGLEFHSGALEAAAEDLGMTLVFCPSHEPRFKGVIERFMRTINTGLIHTLPGSTFSNPNDRGEYDSKGCAVLTVDELTYLVFKWIVEVYSVTLHRGLNAAPLQAWKDLEAIAPPQMPRRPEVLDVYLRPTHTRALSSKGIEINSLFYVCRELDELRLQNGLRPQDVRLQVKANPDNLGSIEVLHPETDSYFTAKCTRPEYAEGTSLEQHKFIKKTARKKYEQLNLMTGLLAAKKELREEAERIMKLDHRAQGKSLAGDDQAAVAGEGRRANSQVNKAKRLKGSKDARQAAVEELMHVDEQLTATALADSIEEASEPAAQLATGRGARFKPFAEVQAFSPDQQELI